MLTKMCRIASDFISSWDASFLQMLGHNYLKGGKLDNGG